MCLLKSKCLQSTCALNYVERALGTSKSINLSERTFNSIVKSRLVGPIQHNQKYSLLNLCSTNSVLLNGVKACLCFFWPVQFIPFQWYAHSKHSGQNELALLASLGSYPRMQCSVWDKACCSALDTSKGLEQESQNSDLEGPVSSRV